MSYGPSLRACPETQLDYSNQLELYVQPSTRVTEVISPFSWYSTQNLLKQRACNSQENATLYVL
jgi:hypothetical protein